jgi:photoactive yellow protein
MTDPAPPHPPLRSLCAWCGATIREGPPAPLSHGICLTCAAASGIFPVENLHGLGGDDLDALPWGTVVLDADGRVMEYNSAEERIAGVSRHDVIGRHFFTEVAPCTGVAEFGGRYAEIVRLGRSKPEWFEFVFRFSEGQLLVEISMAYDPTLGRGTLLVRAVP